MRLEITRRADLATRALLALRDGRRCKASDLADRVGTTPGFLAHAVSPLVTRGWVRSDPGPKGGYSATEAFERVTVLDVIEAVEGPTDTGRCVLEDRACTGSGPCALHAPWSRARGQLLAELAQTRVATLADPAPSVAP